MKRNNLLKALFFVTAFIIFSALIFFYFQVDKSERIRVYLSQKIAKLKSEYKATKNTYDKLTSLEYDEIVSDEKVMRLLAKAAKFDDKAIQELYQVLKRHYDILKRYHINYLSIFTPDGRVLLNMNKPSKKSVLKKRSLFGKIEANELLIEYKRPIYYQNRLLALMHSAISYNVLKQELQRLFRGNYEYIVKKDLIQRSVFNYGNYLFVQSDLSPEYFYEESSIKHNSSQERALIHTINSIIKDKIATQLKTGKNFAIVAKVDDMYYTVTFLAIKKNRTIGYLISYKKDPTIATFDTIFWQNLILGLVLLSILLLFIYYVLETKNRFERMAVTDKLTGLYNRYKFYQVANQEIERSKRHNRPLSLILFDIDWFKKINDTYGHDAGDRVLRSIAKLLHNNLRKYDLIFRWGGEEFIVLAPETDATNAKKLAEKIRTLISSYDFKEPKEVTVSLGVAELGENDTDIDSLVKRADNALYISKKDGRNRTTLSL